MTRPDRLDVLAALLVLPVGLALRALGNFAFTSSWWGVALFALTMLGTLPGFVVLWMAARWALGRRAGAAP